MKRQLPKIIVFLVIGIVIFGVIQDVLTPDWTDQNQVSYTIDGFSGLDENTIDVLFLGTSHMHHGISPMKIYEETGICSYNLGTPNQRIECSYFLLKRAFQTQSPSVVFLDASGLFSTDTESNAAWRYIMDNWEIDSLKIEMALEYDKQTFSDGLWSAIFPVVKYHERWNKLTIDDFVNKDYKNHYAAGQFIYPSRIGVSWKTVDIDLTADILMNDTRGEIQYIADGEAAEEGFEGPIYTFSVSQSKIDWLSKLKVLCTEHNADLVLTKIPTGSYPQIYGASWIKQKSEEVERIAKEIGVKFFDLQYHTETGVDFLRDTTDGGMHLNLSGSEKVAVSVGTYLQENFNLGRECNSVFEENLIKYQKLRKVVTLQTELNYAAYLEYLAQYKEDWTIIIAVAEEYTFGMDDAAYASLEKLGLQLSREGDLADAYVAIIQQGTVEYEAVSNRPIEYSTIIADYPVLINSYGWYKSPQCSIKIDGTEHSMNSRGLNIVIYDNESGLPIDSVVFDTFTMGKIASRDWAAINSYLRAYESAVCFGEG